VAVLLAVLMAGCADSDELKTFPYVPGDSFTTNVRDGGRLMLRSEVVIDVLDQKHINVLEEKEYVVRHTISRFLSEQNEETLRAIGAKEVLGDALRHEINIALGRDYVYKIYLSYFMA
jgi:flagellar basal body-associated protein FliL